MFDGTFCITFVFAIFPICCDVGAAWYTFLPCVICNCVYYSQNLKPQFLNFGITFVMCPGKQSQPVLLVLCEMLHSDTF